jgi:hypothetical protein
MEVEFVNQALKEEGREGKTLVFFRHTYYLRVPFVYGDPSASWAVDPQRLQTTEAWLELFRKEKIRWVVRSSEYPNAIAQPLRQLELGGELAPLTQGEVYDFEGMRVLGVRKIIPIVVLRVKD